MRTQVTKIWGRCKSVSGPDTFGFGMDRNNSTHFSNKPHACSICMNKQRFICPWIHETIDSDVIADSCGSCKTLPTEQARKRNEYASSCGKWWSCLPSHCKDLRGGRYQEAWLAFGRLPLKVIRIVCIYQCLLLAGWKRILCVCVNLWGKLWLLIRSFSTIQISK